MCEERQETRDEKIAFVARQWRQAIGNMPSIACFCGRTAPIRHLYRCLYCGEFYCQPCAEQHFGKTRAQYLAEHQASTTRAEENR